MILSGTPNAIIKAIEAIHPEIRAVLKQARSIVEPSARAVAEYQAACLYALARRYSKSGARVLEIGTAQGYSATILALAMPDATILTLNPHHEEAVEARKVLHQHFNGRVKVIEAKSWDVLELYQDEPFDFIFIDGDHKNVRLDLPWYKHLKTGSLMLFHDYSPNGTYRACPPVYRALEEAKGELGRGFDVLVVDDGGVGMAGFVKGAADDLDREVRDQLAAAHLYSSASFSYLTSLYQLASAVKAEGCLVECGVQSGGSAAALALGLKAARDGVDPKVWLFDNWTGVPKPSLKHDGEKARMRFEQNPDGWSKGDIESVREVFKKVGVKGAKVIEGDFAETFANNAYKTGSIAVLHIDATLYASTKAALERFYPHVVEGGLVIVSAYHHWGGIGQAVHDYFDGEVPTLTQLEKGAYFVK